MNFANDDFISPSCPSAIYARPFAPHPFAYSTSLSIFFLGIAPMPFALMARTVPPGIFAAEEKTENPQSLTRSVTSLSSMPKRRSGLSEPNLSIASCHAMRLIGSLISMPIAFLKRYARSLSFTSITSSTSTKESSMSICVNSGCLSARRSSSLKHLAI